MESDGSSSNALPEALRQKAVGDNELGEFLRSRRAALTPSDAGLPPTGRRRVPGLRREEVAVLAGLSVDYYTRIERGRERHPSAQAIEALGRALGLRPAALEHLYRLARLVPSIRSSSPRVTVDPGLRQLMDDWITTPAMVIDRNLDILARNHLAAALHSGFSVNDNMLRMTFLDPFARRFFRDWDEVAHAAVGHLRLATGHDTDRPRLVELVAELVKESPRFRELWNSKHVIGKTREPKHLDHPDIGELVLAYETFEVSGAPGQQLVAYHAEPGSPSADGLRLLSSLSVRTT